MAWKLVQAEKVIGNTIVKASRWVEFNTKENTMEQPKWVDNFITLEAEGYTVWDETEAGIVGVCPTKQEAIDLCIAYATWLEQQ